MTWDEVEIGHDVPGSGRIIAKEPHTPAKGWHITFRRTEGTFAGEEWSTFHLGSSYVPTGLGPRGLVYGTIPVPDPRLRYEDRLKEQVSNLDVRLRDQEKLIESLQTELKVLRNASFS